MKGLAELNVASLDECLDILWKGERNWHYASTKMNRQSSWSHTVFRIEVVWKISSSLLQESFMNFIDLAGSENISIHDQDPLAK